MQRTALKTNTFFCLAEYKQPPEICFRSVYFTDEIMLLTSIWAVHRENVAEIQQCDLFRAESNKS